MKTAVKVARTDAYQRRMKKARLADERVARWAKTKSAKEAMTLVDGEVRAAMAEARTALGISSKECLRNDTGKARLDMIPVRAQFALAQVYGDGAKKYFPNNWRTGTGWSRAFAAMQRHALKWNSGETYDRKSMSHHMMHVAFWAFALYEWSLDGAGTDDRYVTAPPEEPEEIPSAG